MFSKDKVLLEITPVGAGKQPTKPILEAGDRLDSIEIISIDVAKNQVTLKNNGVVTNMTFEVAKSTTTPPPPVGIPGFNPPQPPNTAAYVPPTPQAFIPNSVGGSPGGRGAVMVAGGNAGTPAAVPNYGAGAYGAGATTVFGGGAVGGGGNAPTVTGGTDIRNIPSRIPRAGNEGQPNQQPNQPPIDPAQQYINMRASELRAQKLNIPHPPTIPLPGGPPGFQ